MTGTWRRNFRGTLGGLGIEKVCIFENYREHWKSLHLLSGNEVVDKEIQMPEFR